MLYFLHTLPQVEYFFHFLSICFLSTKVDPKLGLVEERNEASQMSFIHAERSEVTFV